MTKKKSGRPKGRKTQYSMQNGEVTADELFLYVPEETLPSGTTNRFLERCDHMIYALNPDMLTKPELEEIATYYRDMLMLEGFYQTIRKTPDIILGNQNLIRHLQNISTNLEKKKENLQLRVKDMKEKRNLTKEKTIVDLLGVVTEEQLESEVKRLAEVEASFADQFTSTEAYMEDKVPEGFTPDFETDG